MLSLGAIAQAFYDCLNTTYNHLVVRLEGAGGTAISDVAEADGQGNHSGALGVVSHPYVHNPEANTWSKLRGNFDLTLLASAVRAATTNGSDKVNLNAKGAIFCFDITAVGGGADTVQLEIQAKCSITGNYIPLITSTALSTTGTRFLLLYPTAMGAASWNNYVNGALSANFRAKVTHSAASNFTYAVTAMLIQ